MRTKLIHQNAQQSQDAQRTFAVILDTGDEVLKSLDAFAREQNITAAQVSAIGAFERCTLGYFDWQKKDYRRIPVEGQVEVVSLLGDIGEDEDGKPALHFHVVIGKPDGNAMGGHLLEAHVRPTLEVVVTELPAHLRRRHDKETGLTLIRF